MLCYICKKQNPAMQSRQRILNEAQAIPKHASAMWEIPAQAPTPPIPVGIIQISQLLPSIFQSQSTPEP